MSPSPPLLLAWAPGTPEALSCYIIVVSVKSIILSSPGSRMSASVPSDFDRVVQLTAEKKKRFAEYLERRGVNKALVQATTRIFQEQELPEDPFEYIARQLHPQVFEQVVLLKTEIKNIRAERDELQKRIDSR
ncbi:hypothetical protein CYMTET_8364 [Cymbomonas tetramitiformis]|uniref:Uncharacterized protein n=1 Tax=Cymbomonas tetramitiformis TaxID=36881 RepID=A0AAE0GTM1_9CHLO|nr:hypothetical protein CYMTET_8364 [Cymbomonas tetramitiformis]